MSAAAPPNAENPDVVPAKKKSTPLKLDPGFMAKLDKLDVISRKILHGKMKGERRSKMRGQSVEFADYRNYTKGDDLRFIDWNIYARLDRLFLKMFLEEQDLALYLLIDMSGSTDFGEPNKAHYIKQVAAALGYIGLVNYNRVTVAAMANGLISDTGALRGRRSVPRLLDYLDKLQPGGTTDLEAACKQFAMRNRGKGIMVVLSDFYDKAGYEQGLRYIASGRYDLFALHILSPEEIEPKLKGDFKLIDLEDEDFAEITGNAQALKAYDANLKAYCLELKNYITRRGGAYMLRSTGVPFETVVLNYLRERGLVG